MRRLIVYWLLLFALAPGIPISTAAQASSEVTARKPFSETELIKGLAGGMSAKHLVTLVGEYGVDFSLTPEIEERLRAVGADDELVEGVRKGKAKPLSEADLLKRLAGGMENRRLAAQVSQHGVEFSLAPEIEERLRAAGANDELVAAVRQAKPAQNKTAQGGTKINPKDGLTYAWIPPGTFKMGVSPGEELKNNNSPAHSVTITKDFWMGQTEVKQVAYQRVMGQNPSSFRGDRLPVNNVTWHEANAYCRVVGMRLPTEAEWEYAARAGTTASRYADDLDAIAWYRGNSEERTHEVGQKEPNAWKMYDMLGNVEEWTNDWHDANYYSQSPSQDPRGPSSGDSRTARGGLWISAASDLGVSFRSQPDALDYLLKGKQKKFIGFRCAGEVP